MGRQLNLILTIDLKLNNWVYVGSIFKDFVDPVIHEFKSTTNYE